MVSLERLHGYLSETLGQIEQKLNGAIETLKTKGGELSQAELLALQTQISAWSNLASLISGILRAVGDALKATIQNIR
jgi:hypothetical protein